MRVSFGGWDGRDTRSCGIIRNVSFWDARCLLVGCQAKKEKQDSRTTLFHYSTVQLNGGNCILIFWLIARVGLTRTLIVTYLLPCMALVYGALLLHEPVGLNAIGGLALVLTGIFVTGKKSGQRIAASVANETTVSE